MIELADGACLAIEADPELRIGGERRRQYLDRDGPLESRIARTIDLAL
jgi:hypothetical protein